MVDKHRIPTFKDRRPYSLTFTQSGAVPSGVQEILLNSNGTSLALTIADAKDHKGLLVVKQIDAGTDGHTVTLTSGTWDASNTIVTLNADNEFIIVWIDDEGNGSIVENVGAVALS